MMSSALSIIRLKHRDVDGRGRDAEELPGISPDNPDSYVQAASLLVQCAGVSPEQKVHLPRSSDESAGRGGESREGSTGGGSTSPA